MITQFCNLCQKFVNTRVIITHNFASKSKKSYVSHRKKNIQRSLEKHRLKEILQQNEGRVPIITTKRKEYNFYVGDTFNKFAPILITQGWLNPKSKMDFFTIHPQTEQTKADKQTTSFEELPFSKNLIENVKALGLKYPTNIQMEAFPKLLANKDTIIAAETGSGKTLAYLLPLVEQVQQCYKSLDNRGKNTPIGLIITPSRELAVQIQKEAVKLTYGTDIRTKVIIGGRTKRRLKNPHINDVDILVATLGALSKYVTSRVYRLSHIQHVVLDEADSLFHISFHGKLIPFLSKIKFHKISQLNRDAKEGEEEGAQLTLASATMPASISSVLNDIISVNGMVTATTDKLHSINVAQKFIRIGPTQKPMYLLKLVKEKLSSNAQFIIFTNKSETCNWLSNFLLSFNVNNVNLSAKLPMELRRSRFMEFANRKFKVLCTTDAGSRGLDTIQVKEVINYDFPLQTAEYIHRCGRTGRIGSPKDCKVISFISEPLEIILARKIEIATKKGLTIPIVDMYDRGTINEYESLVEQITKAEEKKITEIINNDMDTNENMNQEDAQHYEEEEYDDTVSHRPY